MNLCYDLFFNFFFTIYFINSFNKSYIVHVHIYNFYVISCSLKIVNFVSFHASFLRVKHFFALLKCTQWVAVNFAASLQFFIYFYFFSLSDFDRKYSRKQKEKIRNIFEFIFCNSGNFVAFGKSSSYYFINY